MTPVRLCINTLSENFFNSDASVHAMSVVCWAKLSQTSIKSVWPLLLKILVSQSADWMNKRRDRERGRESERIRSRIACRRNENENTSIHFITAYCQHELQLFSINQWVVFVKKITSDIVFFLCCSHWVRVPVYLCIKAVVISLERKSAAFVIH